MLRSPLLKWYAANKREMPWRLTKDPYRIWLSEVILQQTRVDQGTPYYERFLKEFPTLRHLARAKQDSVFKLWQGLGYYNRATNLMTAAQEISMKYKGIFPSHYDDLIQLKGIGPYTAAAIASIAFDQPVAVVDGNVSRVLSRYFGVEEAIDTSKGKKQIALLAQEFLDKYFPGEHNQAVMELGALICTPRQPNCRKCPLNNSCAALASKKTTLIPFKTGKQKPVQKYFNYAFILKGNECLLYKRTSGIWKNLYEPPLMETNQRAEWTEILERLKEEYSLPLRKLVVIPEPVYETQHQLTHRRIHARFWIVQTTNAINTRNSPFILVNINNIHQYPVHRLFDKFLKSATFQVHLKSLHVG